MQNQGYRYRPRALKTNCFPVPEFRCRLGSHEIQLGEVSTAGQSVDARIRQLTKARRKKMFCEVANGAKTNCAELRRFLGQREAGDVVKITRLDRPGTIHPRPVEHPRRHYRKEGRIPVAGRHMGRHHHVTRAADADRARRAGGVRARPYRDRTGEGRARAVAAGVKMGRKPKLTPHQRKEALRRVDTGERMRDIARSYNVSHSTISRLAS